TKNRFMRTLVLLPMFTAPIAAGVMWRLIFNTSGPVNSVLRAVGLVDGSISFLGTSPWAFITLIIADVWQWTPLIIILIYAELQNIPESINEAGSLDGVTAWQRFKHLTFPMIVPGVVAATLLKAILGFRL